MTNHTTTAPGSINFVWQPHRNYAYIQEQIFGLIEACLPPKTVVHTVGDAVAGALSLSLFIRQSRDEMVATPADIILAHGIADKRYFFIVGDDGVPLANKYKYVFVPGTWHVDRLVEGRFRRNPKYQITLQDSQIKKVGWLRLDPMVAASLESPPPRHSRLRVLWAPTHNTITNKKSDSDKAPSSFPGFRKHVFSMFLRYQFSISLHPRNRGTKTPTTQKLVTSDVVISDFGTMVFESWALGKPVIFPRWCIDVETLLLRNPLSAEAYIYRNRIGLHAESSRQMHRMLRTINRRPKQDSSLDLRGENVARFIDHYIDRKDRGCDAARTANELLRILEDRV
jgi:hypothetical protein